VRIKSTDCMFATTRFVSWLLHVHVLQIL
jgi:hypothetical protein